MGVVRVTWPILILGSTSDISETAEARALKYYTERLYDIVAYR